MLPNLSSAEAQYQSCQYLQNAEGNYYYDRRENTIYIENHRNWHRDLAVWQLQNTIGKHFGDEQLQVAGARRGAIHSHAGTGTYVSVSILEKEGE